MMPGIESAVVETLNRAVQMVLSVDPDGARAFASLRGRIYCIEFTLPPLTLYLVPDPDGFSFVSETDQVPDVTLSGSIFAFAKMAGSGPASDLIADRQVSMQGDAEAGQALQRALTRLDFDWEELIAKLIGDTPARKVGNAVREFASWAEHSAELTRANVADYLTEESRIMAGNVAMERLEKGVNQLRADTDRLAHRIDRLRTALESGNGGPN